MELSVVLPCYNEEENIEASVRAVAAWLVADGIQGEVIVVNDGSRDRSADVLQRLSKEMPLLKIVTHERNRGYGLAVRSGCDAVTLEWIGFMDSDGQFQPEDFQGLLAHTSTFDCVVGRRRKRADGFIRNAYGKVLGLFICLVFGIWIRDVNCGMKIFKRDIWARIRPTNAVEKLFNTELFLNLKRQTIVWKQVDVPHYPRRAGTPTGGSGRVILRMFKEMYDLKRAQGRA